MKKYEKKEGNQSQMGAPKENTKKKSKKPSNRRFECKMYSHLK